MTDAPHVPVLKDETLGLLKPGPGKRIVDGTFGFGGHSLAILAKGAEVLGLDLDEEAVGVCRRISADRPRLHCAHSSFRSLDQALAAIGWDRADGLLLDLGVSSKQLDAPEKGFSYRAEGPLDLRFDRSRGVSATTLLADIATDELADLIWRYGEETRSRRIARSIIAARDSEGLQTTTQVRQAVETALPRGVATPPVLSRVFQALRIAVNDELAALTEVLAAAPRRLASGAPIVVIAYHSLEDRIVKQCFARESRDCICPPAIPQCVCGHRASLRILTRRVIKASAAEQRTNPRSRSARLRAAEVLTRS